MFAKVVSLGVTGLAGYIVQVEVDISTGLPQFNIVGLPDSAVKESVERVHSAVKNLHYQWPASRITVNLAPAGVRKTGSVYDLPVFIGIMAALSFVAYEFFRVPMLNTGSSFHLGNTFTALTALLLDGVSGGLAGAIGLALADVAAGDPGYAVTTFILKFIIGVVCGAFAHRVFKLQERKAADGVRYYAAVTASAFSGLFVNVFTDPFLGYFRNRYLFGQEADLAASVAKIASGVTLVNSLLSTVCAVALYLALVPVLRKAKLLPALQ